MLGRRGILTGMAATLGAATPRRIDQRAGLEGHRAGVGPAPSGGVILARIVVVGGGGAITGFFEYNGTPGPGNKPVAWAVPAGVTTDPYGNALPVSGGFATAGVSNIYGQLTAGTLLIGRTTDFHPGGLSLAAGDSLQVSSAALTAIDVQASMVLKSAVATGAAAQASFLATQVVIGASLLTGSNALEAHSGSIAAYGAGNGYRTAEVANGKQGVATLAAGTVLVANTSINVTSRIFLTAQDNNTTGALRVSARVAGTSFTITSSNAADTGVVAYEIFEPAV